MNNSCLASYTELAVLPRSYICTINLSIVGKHSAISSLVGICDRVHKDGVTSLNAFQVVQATSFPLPAKLDIVSHPISA